jgi:hypothetical protein
MNYTGEKYSQVEAEAIMATARAHVAGRPRGAEDARQRDVGAGGYRTKITEHARVPAPEPAPERAVVPAPEPAPEDDFENSFIFEVMAQAIAKLQRDFQAELQQRDREIKALHDRIEVEVGLSRKLARAKAAITELQQRAPDFKVELDALRETVAKQEKLISRLRGEQSQLAFAQKQLDAAQQKERRETSVTMMKVTTFGQQTSEILRHLCQEVGVDLVGDAYERPLN